MARCPKCGAENYINCCELCGFEQTRDVLSYYTLSKLNEDDVKFFDTEARLIRNCEKQLKALNSFIKENGTESSGTHLSLRELCEEYLSLTESQPKNEYEGKGAEGEEVKGSDYNIDSDSLDAIFKIFGVSRKTPKPKDEYEGKSAEELYKLGEELYDGQGKEADYEKAFELFSLAAEKGNGDAMFFLGDMYYCGEGVTQDYALAIEWYKKAAENGNAFAMNNLGNMYYFGEGVTQDYKRAFEWFKKAAEKGNTIAMFSLGSMYENGEGVTQDYSRAFEWYKKAAENGNADAMNNLGDMYKKGQGVARDKQKAEEWKQKAEAAWCFR